MNKDEERDRNYEERGSYMHSTLCPQPKGRWLVWTVGLFGIILLIAAALGSCEESTQFKRAPFPSENLQG